MTVTSSRQHSDSTHGNLVPREAAAGSSFPGKVTLREREIPEEGVEAPATTSRETIPERGRSPSTRTELRLSDSVYTHRTTISVSQLNQMNHMSCQMRLREMGIVPLDIESSPTGQLAHLILVNWQKVTKDRWILNTVKGYRISFLATPHQGRKPHPSHFNLDQQSVVEQEIRDLCHKGVVTELSTTPPDCFLSTLFLVPQKDGSQRPVIYLKNLNSFVEVPHFKMEGI